MANERIKIALFKPYNARTTNSFYSGQHPVFRHLQKNYDYEITYFIDDENVKFDTVNVKYIKRSKIKTLFHRVLRKVFKKYKWYWKIPYYKNLDFSKYDIIIAEGIHYQLLDYFKHISYKVILNDSMSRQYILLKKQIDYLNKYFSNSLAVVVNDKIPILYQRNRIKMKNAVIGHSVQIKNIPFVKREGFRGNMISIGRLVPEKGFEYIIQAIRILKKQHPEVKLDIYGDGILREKLQRLIQANGLTNNILLRRFLEYKQLLNKLGNYDLALSHPLETSYIAEAFSMVNVEAMANGLPVITSNCGGVRYVVKDKAIVTEQKDVSQIVKAIEDFIKNPEKIEKSSVEGRKYIEKNYSVEVITKKWDEIIRKFLKSFYVKKTKYN